MPSANSEQLLAIEHNGGVLLSAGAGSGKTFVLVEHICYLLEQLKGQSDLNIKVKARMSQTVLMTFTNKAAGELKVRLAQKLKLKAQQENDPVWELALSNLDQLSTGTIHSFCLKLIRQGYFTKSNPDSRLINDYQFRKKMRKIISRWFSEKLDHYQSSTQESLIRYHSRLISSMERVFSDSSLRQIWDQSTRLDSLPDFEKTIQEIFKHKKIVVLDQKINIEGYRQFADKKWFQFLEEFEKIKYSFLQNSHHIKILNDFLTSSRISAPRKNFEDQSLIDYFEGIKDLKNFLKKYGDDLSYFISDRNLYFDPWWKAIRDLYLFTVKEYYQDNDINFADLEYSVLAGLNSNICQKIAKDYRYFIVDEFQDTSNIQYQILQLLIEGDFNRIFCVGDVKQAIYGFRGGELAVFQDCQQKAPLQLSLKNNYRSQFQIINFNNEFYSYLFKLGYNYQGTDAYEVPVLSQVYPFDDQSGKIEEIAVELSEGSDTISSQRLNDIEAEILISKIQESYNPEGNETIAILYKKLKASWSLIPLLIRNNISFIAQVKINYVEDPIIGIFYTLLKFQLDLDCKRKTDQCAFLVLNYLYFWGQHKNISEIQNLCDRFYAEQIVYGLEESFCRFLQALGCTISEGDHNFAVVSELCLTFSEDIEKIFLYLGQEGMTVSTEFHFGEAKNKVQLMTAHASKGLEFDYVFLAGIQTNGATHNVKDFIGYQPGSLMWSHPKASKKIFQSPWYILESTISEQKDFSEAKRLLYVATTRAIQKITYIVINTDNIKCKVDANSWVFAFKKFRLENPSKFENLIEQHKINYSLAGEKSEIVRPLFHHSGMGISFDQKAGESTLLTDLSVTSLATISECSLKFYFKNICRFKEQELKLFDREIKNFQVTDHSRSKIISNAQRGTEIHEVLATAIVNNFVLSLDHFNHKDKKNLEWVLEYLKEQKDAFKFISEQEIKFTFFDIEINGIPDLVCLSTNGSAHEVWDFKTGESSDLKESNYWFQLSCYAYALYRNKLINIEDSVILKICYVDLQIIKPKKIELFELENFLRSQWLKTRDYTQIDERFCQTCQFSGICHSCTS